MLQINGRKYFPGKIFILVKNFWKYPYRIRIYSKIAWAEWFKTAEGDSS